MMHIIFDTFSCISSKGGFPLFRNEGHEEIQIMLKGPVYNENL